MAFPSVPARQRCQSACEADTTTRAVVEAGQPASASVTLAKASAAASCLDHNLREQREVLQGPAPALRPSCRLKPATELHTQVQSSQQTAIHVTVHHAAP